MFDIEKVDRDIELFIFDIYIAILKIVDFRNQITHEYFGISRDIIWFIIHHDLKDFQKVILELIKKIEPNLKQELIEAFIEDNKYLDFIVLKLKKLTDEKK